MYTHRLVAKNRRYEVLRRHRRLLISVPVVVARPNRPDLPAVHGLSLDLSHSGVSAVLCGYPVVGETVRVSLQFSGVPLESEAIVRHSSPARSGFEFVDLSTTQREWLKTRIRPVEERRWPWRPEAARAGPQR